MGKFKALSDAIYPKWWPEDDIDDETDNILSDTENENDENVENMQPSMVNMQHNNPPHCQHPNIYNQPIAFSVPTEQFNKNEKDNIVQLHVNLYPEYMQKCLDNNNIINNPQNQQNEVDKLEMYRNKNVKKEKPKRSKRDKNNRSRSLTRCTESSQAKSNGNRPQSAYLKSVNRNIAPCLKYQKQP